MLEVYRSKSQTSQIKPANQKYNCTEQACGNRFPTSTRKKKNTAEGNNPSIKTKGYYKRKTQTISTVNSLKRGRPKPTKEASQLSQDKENSRKEHLCQPSRARGVGQNFSSRTLQNEGAMRT